MTATGNGFLHFVYPDLESLTLALADALAEQVADLPRTCVQVDEASVPGSPENAPLAQAVINRVLDNVSGQRFVVLFRCAARITLAQVNDTMPHGHDLTGRRRGWPAVAVFIWERSVFALEMLDMASRRRWRLIDLAKFHGRLPPTMAVQGAIMNASPDDPIVRDMLDRGIPVVRMTGWPHPQDPIVPAAMADRRAAGRLALEHLAERDFKHIAIVGPAPWEQSEMIYDAAAARAAELGCDCHPLRVTVVEDPACEPGETPVAARWRLRQAQFNHGLAALPKPIGLMAFSMKDADRYCYWAIEAGLRVPEDVAIVGIDDDRYISESSQVPLTSVAHDNHGVANAAADLLTDLMAGRTPRQTTVLVPPLGIVQRQSTDVLAASDPFVVDALRYMWDHVAEDLSVDQIAKRVGVARRTLEKAFRRELGRGINEELQRRRLQKARELVRHTDLPMSDVAASLGYGAQSQLSRAFRAAYGTTPARYRREHR